MADVKVDTSFPVIPASVDADMRKFLLELRDVLNNRLVKDVIIGGNLEIGNNVIVNGDLLVKGGLATEG